ncbi:MAG TPA: endolytic transglycosylase MltG [Candidatus Ozemobacteraceae bacterium]|nr:endolytic transglycosylase MltG [Candidatus Ozemobacteraceae bacterium]
MSLFRSLLGLGAMFVIAAVGFLAGGYLWFDELHRPVDAPTKAGTAIEVEIRSGATPKEIAARLKAGGIIRSAFLFRLMTGLYGVDTRLKPGKYQFKGGESIEEILRLLMKGREELVRLTIPEGLTLEAVSRLVESAGLASAATFLELTNSPRLRASVFGEWGELPSLEGMTFPETYAFPRTITPEELVLTLLRQTRDRVDRLIGSPKSSAGLTRYETCILASLVEREAKLASERPLVASVFLNRLRSGMRLESCATVQYALPEHKERLTFDDLKIESPYNTYQKTGLPPTPISNFGESSLAAAVHPATTEYLFFVSDAAEGHRFSTTLAEHERSRKEFFQNRKKKNR